MDERPVWHERWFQHLLVVLVVAATLVLVVPSVLAVIYAVRPVLLPVLIAVALAYAANPLATWAKRVLHLPRVVSTALIMFGALVIVTALGLYLVPKLVFQIYDLANSLPGYVESAAQKLNIDLSHIYERMQETVRAHFGAVSEGAAATQPSAQAATQPATQPATQAATTTATQPLTTQPTTQAATQPATQPAATQPAATQPGQSQPLEMPFDVATIAERAVAVLGVGIGVIGSTIGYVTYLTVAAVIIAFCFFFFLWKWPVMTGWFVQFIPVRHRQRTLDIVSKMDASVSGFIRGRLIQSIVIAIVLSTGWGVTGVPYFLLLGIGGGLLNLIPYAAVISWPLAIALAWLDSISGNGFSFWWVIFWPSIIYFIAQGLDGWVVEPLVQGKATNLDPLTVLLAVLIGGSVAGLLGLLIAIPTAACGKILAQEVVLPRLRKWAAAQTGPPPNEGGG